MTQHNAPTKSKKALFATLIATIFGLALMVAALPALSLAAGPAAGSHTILFQAQPTAEVRQTDNQSGSQGQNPLNGSSSQNQNGANDNTTSSGENTNQNGQTGSTGGGNVAGNTGGAGGTGIINWWTVILAAIVLVVIVAVWMRVRPIKQIATSIGGVPADQQARDEQYKDKA